MPALDDKRVASNHLSDTGCVDEWAPIRYADFCDVPRLFAVEHEPPLLFDCPFDGETDEYGDTYRVLQLEAFPLTGELDYYSTVGRLVGGLQVEDVEFDETRRRFIRASILEPFAD